MTKEEKEALLEEAKRKYPIGCIPRCLTGGSTGKITKQSHHSFEDGWYPEKKTNMVCLWEYRSFDLSK